MPHDPRMAILLRMAVQRGLHSAAIDDVMRRGDEFLHLAPEELTTDTLKQWGDQLDAAPHLFTTSPTVKSSPAKATPNETADDNTAKIPDWLSPTEKLTRARKQATAGGSGAQSLAPALRETGASPPADLAAQWAKLTPAARLDAYRQWARTQQGA
jgi:hypothetical protein